MAASHIQLLFKIGDIYEQKSENENLIYFRKNKKIMQSRISGFILLGIF